MKRFDLSLSYFHVAKRFFAIFGFVYLLFIAQLSSRISDTTTFYVATALFLFLLFVGTYARYAWYFKESSLTIDDEHINWHRSGEDHLFTMKDISGVRLPHRLAQYYGMSYFQLRFRNGPSLNLDLVTPGYDDIVDEIVARMKLHPHLRDFVAEIEDGKT